MSSRSTYLLLLPCRQDVGVEELVSLWLIYHFSRTFSLDYLLQSIRFPDEILHAEQTLLSCHPRVIFTAVAQWKCRTVCEREGTQGWGGGFGGATQRWLALRNTQSLRRGRHCRLEKGLCSTEVCGHHWLWESIKLLHRKKKRGRDAVSSSSRPNHIVAMCVCVPSYMPNPRRQPEGPCDATHSQVQCMAGLVLVLAESGWDELRYWRLALAENKA